MLKMSLLKNLQTTNANNSIILRINKAKFSGYFSRILCKYLGQTSHFPLDNPVTDETKEVPAVIID